MTGSLLGSVGEILQTLFLVRYLVLQPAWEALKAAAIYPALNELVSLLAAVGNREIPFD